MSKYDLEVLSDNPVGYWKLDETSGTTAVDASGNELDGTYFGSPFLNSQPGVSDGNSSVSFDGIDDRVNLGDSPKLKIIGNQTIEMWINPTSFSRRENPWNKAYGGEGTITQETNAGMNYYYGTAGGDSSPYQSHTLPSNTLIAKEWQHIIHVRDLNEMKLRWYHNGILVSEIDANYTEAVASTNIAQIAVGYTNYYMGQIDKVAIYDYALTSNQIQAHYEVGSEFSDYSEIIFHDEPISYFTMDELPSEMSVYRDEPDIHSMGDGTLNQVVVVNNSLQLAEETAGNYYLSGTRNLPILDLSVMENIAGSKIRWIETKPTSTNVIVETSPDGNTWTTATNGGEVPNVSAIWGAGGDN